MNVPQGSVHEIKLGPVVIYGPAQPQGSKRVVEPEGQRARLIEDCAKSRPWRAEVAWAMREQRPAAPLDTAVHVGLCVYVRRPRNHYGTGRNSAELKRSAPVFPPSGIDLDKIQRSVGDAGTGVWWRDDQRIASWNTIRLYTADEERVEITAWAMEAEEAAP